MTFFDGRRIATNQPRVRRTATGSRCSNRTALVQASYRLPLREAVDYGKLVSFWVDLGHLFKEYFLGLSIMYLLFDVIRCRGISEKYHILFHLSILYNLFIEAGIFLPRKK